MKMKAETNHQFSDSDEEREDTEEIGFDDETGPVETVSKALHESIVSKLVAEIENLKIVHTNEIAHVVGTNTELTALYKKDRSEHADEMEKRQTRIDFLVDKMISR